MATASYHCGMVRRYAIRNGSVADVLRACCTHRLRNLWSAGLEAKAIRLMATVGCDLPAPQWGDYIHKEMSEACVRQLAELLELPDDA
jgi:hypothetical protein